MKKIEAVISAAKLPEVKSGLSGIGINRMTLLEAKTWGRERARPLVFRGTEYMVDVSPMVKVEVVADEERAEEAVEIIARATETGEGEVYVSAVESGRGMVMVH